MAVARRGAVLCGRAERQTANGYGRQAATGDQETHTHTHSRAKTPRCPGGSTGRDSTGRTGVTSRPVRALPSLRESAAEVGSRRRDRSLPAACAMFGLQHVTRLGSVIF